MPRLSANLTFLFNEVPFLDRFGEAARAGFRAIEFAFAYEVPETTIAALPGRDDEFAASFAKAAANTGRSRQRWKACGGGTNCCRWSQLRDLARGRRGPIAAL